MTKSYRLFLSVSCLICYAAIGEEAAVGDEAFHICRYHDESQIAEHSQALAEANVSPRKYAPPRLVDVLHIKIDVTPDFGQRTVAGTTTITCTPISKPVKTLRLDAVRLTIDDVRCDAAKVADFTASDEDLTIVFESPIPVGSKFHLEMDHAAQPTKGLYFRTPEMGYPKGDTHVWTQGEPHEARHWFPCFDYPNERSTTEIICHVPPEMTVLSNGKRIAETIDSETKLKAVRWRMDQPHVSYLICLVAGHFKKLEKQHRDVPLAFYTQPSLFENAENSFRDTADIMAFFEQEIGVPYPWSKYDQVTIRDFVAGGMENTTLTTLTHRTIFDEATENIHSSRGLDAHEMAHQWFGDYVTCKDWSHLWLNEGFATYYAHLYEGHKFGRDALLYGLYRDAKNRVLTQANDTKPIVYREYSQARQQFDYRAYPKGSWVLHMLRSQLGEDLYRQCFKTYLERNALGSVVTEDLNEVLEEVSGRSFDPFFDQWVYHARHPDLKVTYRWLPEDKLAHVTVQQTQPTSDDVLLFRFKTQLRFIIDGEKLDHDIEIHESEHEFFVPLTGKPSIVRFDPRYTVLANVTFDKTEELQLAQLGNGADVIGRLLAIKGLGKRKTHKAIAAIQQSLNSDPFFGVRIEASGTLQDIHNDESFDALQASLQQEDARVRQQVVRDIGRFVRDETEDSLQQVVRDERNPAIRAAAVAGLGRFAGADKREQLVHLLNTDSFRNEIAAASVSAMRTQDDPWFARHIATALSEREAAFSGRSLTTALNALARLSKNKKQKSKARKQLSGYLSHPKESVRIAAIRALGELGDMRAAVVLEPLADAELSERVQQAAKSALNKLRESAPIASKEVADLRKRIDSLEDEYDKLKKKLDSVESKKKSRNQN